MVRPGRRRSPAGGATEGYFAEPGSFAAFYRSHYSRLLGWFARRVSEIDQARDLTAETFAAAFEERLAFRGDNERTARAWVFAIGEFKLKRFYNHKTVQAEALTRLRIAWDKPDDHDLRRVEEIADAQAAGGALRAALSKLSPAELEVVLRHTVEGVPFPEIVGDSLDSKEALKKRHARALVKLSGLLSGIRGQQENQGREVDGGEP